jgi:hypothetical protein
MGWLQSVFIEMAPRAHLGAEWLKEQLRAQGIKVPLSAGCVEELVRDAHAAYVAKQVEGEAKAAHFREEITARAHFIVRWTQSNERFDQPEWAALVSIARKYALPRCWKREPLHATITNHAPAHRI